MTTSTIPRPTTGRGNLAPCGTESAYKRHVKRGEATCLPCRRAHAAYQRVLSGVTEARPRTVPLPSPQPFTASDADRLLAPRIHEWCGQLDDPARNAPCPCRVWKAANP